MTVAHEEKAPAGVRTRTLPTTFVLAALIFGIAGLSALWLLVIAGLAALWVIGAGFLTRFCVPLFERNIHR
jgi:hypothetical protein